MIRHVSQRRQMQFAMERIIWSWAGMCPGNNESAGKHRNGHTRNGSKWLETALIEAAKAASRSKKSYLSEYSSRITHPQTTALLSAYQRQIAGDELLPGHSFNLDFHSVPYHGEHPVIERHYLSMRSRSQKSILTFLAQDADGHAFCYANADLRKGEEAEEIFRFISFWEP